MDFLIGISIINGCTDSIALNYDSLANFDDGSCCFNIGQIDNGMALFTTKLEKLFL